MPTETTTSAPLASIILNNPLVITFIHLSIFVILIFYAIFALLIVRQVDLMSKTLNTPVSPLVKAFAIVHAGFAIGIIFLVWGGLT